MRWVLYPLSLLAALGSIGGAALVVAAMIAWPRLPELDTLTDYRPKIPLRVFSADGHLLGEFGEERRRLVDIAQVPAVLRHAILAAEDERFYEHPGIDPVGIARAALANVTSGGRGQGASTITMQVARNFFLSRDKTYNRKFYEVLLALKIEHNLSKDQILELYINQIYLGSRAYGFGAAAHAYFAKPLDELTLGEAAMLAGLPKAPSAYNPFVNPARAHQRQKYVLRRMLDAGFIDRQAHDEAAAHTVQLVRGSRSDAQTASVLRGNYIAEMARRIALEQFGDNAYEIGLRIHTTVQLSEQLAAEAALRNGVLAYDQRHDYRGPEGMIRVDADGASAREIDAQLAAYPDVPGLTAAVVIEADPQRVRAYYDGNSIEIEGKGLQFVKRALSDKAPPAQRLRPGAIIRLTQDEKLGWKIVQIPEVQAALLSIDTHTGAVRALAGGFDFNLNEFNHVTQALRQPGSSFKPFVYSAALEKGFSPGSWVEDEPLFFPAEVTGSDAWEPGNYDGKYDGLMTLRRALARSKNMVSIRVLQSITPAYAQSYASRFGFSAEDIPPYLTMALGAGAATPWQMASAYAVFANGGFRVEPYLVSHITDNDGNTLARVEPVEAGKTAPRVIDPRNAWLMTSMLRDVVRSGTGRRAMSLGRNDLAGKTGTTNDYIDAWFCGYNADVAAVAWLGFSQPKKLGRGETGGSAALPIWIDYMKVALKGMPEHDYERPDGLIAVVDDGSTDFIYRENTPPVRPVELVELPFELNPAFGDSADALPPVPPSVPSLPRDDAPAPVVERRFNF